jgi:hypothetical protein
MNKKSAARVNLEKDAADKTKSDYDETKDLKFKMANFLGNKTKEKREENVKDFKSKFGMLMQNQVKKAAEELEASR